jgi:hypothetical protein
MKYHFTLIALLATLTLFAQSDDSTKTLSFSGYAELYYSYDFSKPANHEKPNFIYNHKRHNELNLNLAFAKASYSKANIRGNMALMLGNYAQYNMSAEPIWAQFVYEANIGVKLSKKNNLWIDAGIMPSHIGFESALGADCWTLTRSILAENSPYYETGAKLSYVSKNEKLTIAAMLLNGWQKIQRPNNFQKPSFGMQFFYKPTNKITFNYSNFIGTDKPDSLHAFRHFHNFYAIFEPSSKFGITAGFDFGMEKNIQNTYDNWYSPVLIIRHSFNDKTRMAIRAEYYSDPKQMIISTGTTNGFQTFGLSSNFDYDLNDKIKFRIEGKMYQSKDRIFANKNNNFATTTSLSIKL